MALLLGSAGGCQPSDYPPFGPGISLSQSYPSDQLSVGFFDKHLLYSYQPHEFVLEEATVQANGTSGVPFVFDRPGLLRFSAPSDAQRIVVTATIRDWHTRYEAKIPFNKNPSPEGGWKWKPESPIIREIGRAVPATQKAAVAP
jgi:hypothetical protein